MSSPYRMKMKMRWNYLNEYTKMDTKTIFYITIALTILLAVLAYVVIRKSSIENFVANYTER